MIRHIALALAVAAIATSAAAQSSRKQPAWDDLLKPLDVKTNPAVPVAPSEPDRPFAASFPLADGCVHQALGRIPQVEGARVASTKPEFSHSLSGYYSRLEVWNIFVTIDFNGKPVHYRFTCRVSPEVGLAELKNY